MKPVILRTIGAACLAMLLAGTVVSAAEEQPPQPSAVATPQASPTPPLSPAATPVSPALPAAQPKADLRLKLGYVDMAKIAAESEAGKAAMATMKEKTDRYRSQITAKQKQLEKMKSSLEAKLATLTPQQREAKVKELRKKAEEFQNYVQKAEKELGASDEEMTRGLLKRIAQVAEEYGRANGYAVIVQKRELLYLGDVADARDITAEIMQRVSVQP